LNSEKEEGGVEDEGEEEGKKEDEDEDEAEGDDDRDAAPHGPRCIGPTYPATRNTYPT
jgi:hypothetical protein